MLVEFEAEVEFEVSMRSLVVLSAALMWLAVVTTELMLKLMLVGVL